MPRTRPAYAPQFRQQIIALYHAGRSVSELAREFEPSSQAIRDWIKQADLDTGKRRDGLTTEEKEELTRLGRELKQVKLAREILAKGAARFARKTEGLDGRFSRIRESQSGHISDFAPVPSAGGLPQRVLRLCS